MTTATAWRPGDPLYDRRMSTGCPRWAFEVLNVHLDGDCATCGDPHGLHYIDGWRWSPTEPVMDEWRDLCSPAGPGTDFYGGSHRGPHAMTVVTGWTPGDPLYEREVVSYDITVNRTYDPCPPGCWHYHPGSYGHGMRWSPEWPVLRFPPCCGLIVTGPEPHTIYRGVA